MLQIQQLLSGIAKRAKEGDFLYSKFFAIGLFRLLELTGAKDPQALGSLVKAMNIRQEGVNRDLMTYKGILSKLSAAKEVSCLLSLLPLLANPIIQCLQGMQNYVVLPYWQTLI